MQNFLNVKEKVYLVIMTSFVELLIIPRNKNPRKIRCDLTHTYFKPRGVPLSEIRDEVALTFEELEAIRLTDLEGLTQQEAGEKMNISQSTISRDLERAHHKIAKALVLGFAIRIANPVDFLHCDQCGHTWLSPKDESTVHSCDKCGSTNFHAHVGISNDSTEIESS